jgi:uncharacterized protein YjiS (DUF1127 family)
MNVARTLNSWRNYRRTVSELGRMTARQLDDVGIEPDQIRTVARAAFNR